jgi:ATP adenylyltransferase/5',5'''-P-1,P-4-tetraphosphate phosphorylase II
LADYPAKAVLAEDLPGMVFTHRGYVAISSSTHQHAQVIGDCREQFLGAESHETI